LRNYRTIAGRTTAELNINFEDPVSVKTIPQEPHKINMHDRHCLRLVNLRLLNIMFTCVNGCVMTIKFGYHTTANTSFMLLPASGRVYVWRITKEVMPGSSSETWARVSVTVMVWTAVTTFISKLLLGSMWAW
jgi:hypothetical protein